jgi:urease accessory protein
VSFSDQWRIRVDGRLIHAEATRITGDFTQYQGIGCLNGARATATILYVGPDAMDRLDQARALDVPVSAWAGKLVVRLMHDDARALRQHLTEFLRNFRGCDLPRVWTM